MTFETDSDAALREREPVSRNEIKCWRCGRQLITKPFYEVAIMKRPSADRLKEHRREDLIAYAPICIECAENRR